MFYVQKMLIWWLLASNIEMICLDINHAEPTTVTTSFLFLLFLQSYNKNVEYLLYFIAYCHYFLCTKDVDVIALGI